MTNDSPKPASLFSDILQSFISLPKWVKFWLMFILGPVNMASIFFLGEPGSGFVVFLVVAGMLLSLAPVPFERGLSKATAIGHVVPWTLLVAYILFARPEGSGSYQTYLTVLAVVNAISLAFDYVDSLKWLKGDRAVARPKG
ncbi:hypothetical protein C1J03_19915 [Sulfitobacter sp. SK012]|uniref:hypothetical protein n=1 Tax=Sulfitobacter sp. SK012 TaxID=1389005 RepID=UPI000E0B2645|nr:hypothetical protein [Sulfitobacter sp. SK012]AXI48068.1 hypothetical protein C1J03_19915 [Sulfitobacter sp. SK012]